MTNWNYFRCLNCGSTSKTTVDNPDHHVHCDICGHSKFVEVAKEEFEAMGEMKRWMKLKEEAKE